MPKVDWKIEILNSKPHLETLFLQVCILGNRVGKNKLFISGVNFTHSCLEIFASIV